MRKIKNFIKKYRFLGIFGLVLLFSFGITFSRYAFKYIKNYYLNSKRFYFNSDLLSEEGAVHEVDFWDGVNAYNVDINLNNRKNNILVSDADITYKIKYSCSIHKVATNTTINNVVCNASKTSGTIEVGDNEDTFSIRMIPPSDSSLKTGDSMTLNVSVTSTSPYEKTLSGSITLVVGLYEFSYEIIDSEDSPYLELSITNALSGYGVVEGFTENGTTYSEGDHIATSDYNNLSSENKKKCASALIELDFDPNLVRLDTTSSVYLDSYDYRTINTLGDGFDYVNYLKFGMVALSSTRVKFYKVDTSQDYTYPIVNDSSIITVNPTTYE